MQQKVLVVEDDAMIRNLIRMYLEKHDYEVVEASDGEEAKTVFLAHHPCLVILDLMLPKVSGEAFCAWVREHGELDASIIMLTAKIRTDDKVAGLRMGADDYLTKPFEPRELMAHVEAVLRRTGQLCHKITHKGLCIMPRRGKVLLHDKTVELTHHEFQLLYYFMQNPDIVLSREQLIMEIYPDEEKMILDRTIDAHIKKLREKIEVDTASPEYIQTVRGMGYKFGTA